MTDNNNKDNINQAPDADAVINMVMDDLIDENENTVQNHLHGNEENLRHMMDDTLQKAGDQQQQIVNQDQNDNNNNNEKKDQVNEVNNEPNKKDVAKPQVNQAPEQVEMKTPFPDDENMFVDNIIAADERSYEQEIETSIRQTMFLEKLSTYNKMFKTNVDAEKFITELKSSWEKIDAISANAQEKGEKQLANLFKGVLSEAFEVEKKLAYDEHRLPDYAEIVRSTNELLRVALFDFTDLYTRKMPANAKSTMHKTGGALFRDTAFGGLDAKEMAALTGGGESYWSMDQKSDEAWAIQSRPAMEIADLWFKDEKPYDRVISEMNALAELGKDGITDSNRKEIYNKLAAAEWMLLNNEKLMIQDPDDPLVTIPNWGCKYWKALADTREALGIPRHIPIRELIQGDYAESSKAVNCAKYAETQINEQVLDDGVVETYDSMDVQKSVFNTQLEGLRNKLLKLKLDEPEKDSQKQVRGQEDPFKDSNKVSQPVPEEDEFAKMFSAPIGKEFIPDNSLVINSSKNIGMDNPNLV